MTKKTMKTLYIKLVKAFLLVDSVLLVSSFFLFDRAILWSTQIGYFSAALVLMASIKSYSNMVNGRVDTHVMKANDADDIIDKIEDPYDLYSEEIIEEERDLVEVFKEERQKNKASKRTFFQTARDTKAALSFYRLGAYVLLVIGFLYLNKQGYLEIIPYILALSVPMFVMVWVLLSEKKNLES